MSKGLSHYNRVYRPGMSAADSYATVNRKITNCLAKSLRAGVLPSTAAKRIDELLKKEGALISDSAQVSATVMNACGAYILREGWGKQYYSV